MKRSLFLWIATAFGAGCGVQVATAHDPCTLLAASEAEPYVGPLATPPYRASDGAADARGDECLYRGTDGREVAVRPTWHGGHVAGQVLQGVPRALGGILSKADPGFDTLIHRVMQQGPVGPWDQTTWIPGGSLFATKGDAQVSIDMSGASGRQEDALALARIMMPRFVRPLAYDGAKAVALAPRPKAHPAAACDLAPRADVEAAIGPLAAAPSSDSPPTSCTYRVTGAGGDRTYPVEFTWQNGQKSYRMLTHGMAAVSGLLGTPASTPLDTLHPSADMGAAIGGLMKMVTGSAGASVTEGVRTDTALAGPWDHAALLHGTLLMAVKGDVLVGINLAAADYDKAKTLLGVICARL